MGLNAPKKQVYGNAFSNSFSEIFPESSAQFPFVEMTPSDFGNKTVLSDYSVA